MIWQKLTFIFKENQFEDPALKNSCKDLIKSVNSLVGVGLTAGEEDSVGELSHPLYRSHSSSLHSNSYISLLCRRMSLGKSSMTLSERSRLRLSRGEKLLLVYIEGMTPSVRATRSKMLTWRENYGNTNSVQQRGGQASSF